MRKGKRLVGFSILWLVFIMMGCDKLNTQNVTGDSAEKQEVKMFAEFTDNELFQNIPVMTIENGNISEAEDMGGANYVITVNGGTLEEYQTYVNILEQNGFLKYVDSGEDGINGNVFSTTFTRDELVLTVIHVIKTNLTYIVAEDDLALSEHLFYKDEYVNDNIEGAKTTLHMLELYNYGNSFVIQLKNGHFLVCDGGREKDLSYLIDYLEQLTPEGQKPVIEAWMISHLHADHAEVFEAFNKNWTYAERIYVEGIYVDLVNSDIATSQGVTGIQLALRTAVKKLKTTEGKSPEIYRPHAGQKYYFNDITIEVMQTMVQCPEENWYRYSTNLNEFSTWLMFHIEGQKFLNAGDADFGSMRAVMRSYDAEYLDMDIMAVQHHGINVHKEFTDFITVKTLIYPYYGVDGVFEEGQSWSGSWQASVDRNAYLHEKALEMMSYGDGTKVLSFPYKIGTAQSLDVSRDRVDLDDTRIQYY